jgi:hypothetical protein
MPGARVPNSSAACLRAHQDKHGNQARWQPGVHHEDRDGRLHSQERAHGWVNRAAQPVDQGIRYPGQRCTMRMGSVLWP